MHPLALIEHHLNDAAYLSVVASHVHPSMTTVHPPSYSCFQHITKLKSSQTGLEEHVLNMTVFALLQWPPQLPDLNPVDHLWDAVLYYHVNMDQNLWGMFQHLVESIP